MQQTAQRSRVKPDGKRPPLRTVDVGGRVLVYYDSVLQALGIDPATEPERPKTVTIPKTLELMGLSRRTVTRMIADGRAEQARAPLAPTEHASL
jgi:hypothetical protein